MQELDREPYGIHRGNRTRAIREACGSFIGSYMWMHIRAKKGITWEVYRKSIRELYRESEGICIENHTAAYGTIWELRRESYASFVVNPTGVVLGSFTGKHTGAGGRSCRFCHFSISNCAWFFVAHFGIDPILGRDKKHLFDMKHSAPSHSTNRKARWLVPTLGLTWTTGYHHCKSFFADTAEPPEGVV